MKPIRSRFMKAAASCALLTVTCSSMTLLSASAEHPHYGRQDKNKQSAPSDGEQKAMAKVEAAPDVAAKIVAAGEFIKKYPKSTLRSKVVSHIAQEVTKIQEGAQRITQLENMLTVFKEPGDGEVINPILIELYFKESRPDDGFRVASTYLAKNPNDVAVLTQAALEGVEQAKKKEAKFAQQSLQFGGKAIEVIESGKKPDTLDDAKWGEFQSRWLPVLYQSLGLLSMMIGNKTDARARLDKAASLNAKDPFTFVLIGSMLNDDYQQLAEQHKAASPGPLKDTILKQAHAKLDEVIDLFAHAVGLSEGNAAYQQLHDQILQDLQAYYKYRHGGSSDGLQQLIDKYKMP
ncbi:MAG TPA: hypothetical protein VI837_05465 [Blastocatellia bacterium]|nr:hypothetical protein [Blastocatellia bacterium]